MARLVGERAKDAPVVVLDFIATLDDALQGVEVQSEHNERLSRWEVTVRGHDTALFTVQDSLVQLVERASDGPAL